MLHVHTAAPAHPPRPHIPSPPPPPSTAALAPCSFDCPRLGKWLAYLGFRVPPCWRYVDTLQLSIKLNPRNKEDKPGSGKHKLGAVFEAMGGKAPLNAHRCVRALAAGRCSHSC